MLFDRDAPYGPDREEADCMHDPIHKKWDRGVHLAGHTLHMQAVETVFFSWVPHLIRGHKKREPEFPSYYFLRAYYLAAGASIDATFFASRLILRAVALRCNNPLP